ncbi:AAEL008862-PA [Aedes aegypti]|uniref:AAEL008862-PA n=1 Tax=Aedes aegypti TaxID=7159 RepID=Q16XJ0_AEDAE|nr:AAEL008862-PA [Aedes aegypti]
MSFKLISSAKANGVIPVRKYRSERTGLSVVVGEVEGPLVNGYFALATEAHDDDGLPHTLEHLIFLGSEKYPFKGILDLVANRCLASGTNAWTDTDHTCYTMTTAGSGGFLSLLPVYLDHILYPTLTDSGFTTEVHHISEEGEDGGVVYCEMQGRENTGESRIHLDMLRAIYPNCGYSSETGGIMANLRTSTTNEKVRAYHAGFYRPDNLHVIITGQIEPEDIFKALEPVEEKILSKGDLPAFTRPWQTPVEPLAESKDIKIVYPADEEDCGLVNVAWRGPKATSEYEELTACSVLLRYLSDTSVSPLQREFVEIEDPFASRVGYNIAENAESLLYISFENVPLSKIDDIHAKLKQVLEKIGKGEEKIDMKRMENVLERYILESLSNLESSPHDNVAFHVIGDVLYGAVEQDFDNRLNANRFLQKLKEKKEDFWVNLLNKYLIDANHVVVRAVPSIEEQKRSAKEEMDRIEQQRATLGEEGLAKKGKQVAEAMAANEVPPPDEMLTSIPVPSTDGIKFHPVEIFKATGDGKNPAGLDLKKLPVYAEAYNLHTNFCYLMVTMNTESVEPELRPYLLLLMELLTESPIRRGDELIPYEAVVAALEADTIATEAQLGIETRNRFSLGPFSNSAILSMQVVRSKYETGINWIADLLQKTEFTTERVKVCASKMVNDVAQAKREGNSIVRDLLKAMYYEKDSNVRVSSLLKQQKFLSTLIEQLDNEQGAEKVINKLNKVREIITQPKNLGLHIAADWEEMAKLQIDLEAPWSKLVKSEVNDLKKELIVIPDWKLINMDGNLTDSTGVVVGMGSVESAFLYQSSKAITDFNDEDLAPLLLFLQYLTQLEGPLWRQIRGQGFSYGYNIVPRPNEGLLYFTLYRATNLVAAYKEAKSITEKQLQPDAEWDSTLLESARSSLIFEIIAREKSIGNVVEQSFLSSFKQVSVGYNQALVRQVGKVTEADLARVGSKYVKQLFSAEARTAIVCHPDKAADVATAFNQLGHNLKVENSLEGSILA